MADVKNPIDKFISDLGGTVVVAKAAGVAPSVVSFWRTSGRIPIWRLPAVMAINPKIEFPGNAPKKPRLPRKVAA